ncbi:uncharacterized protein [Ptychodera flava]|uniref:uncharacterized protein n=1 Tax=Ptychodera flava TaxID=63121 RepID=UPI00396A03AF
MMILLTEMDWRTIILIITVADELSRKSDSPNITLLPVVGTITLLIVVVVIFMKTSSVFQNDNTKNNRSTGSVNNGIANDYKPIIDVLLTGTKSKCESRSG